MDIADWFQVRFDAAGIYRSAQPPGAGAWADHVRWADIIRVCLEVEDFISTEALYIFTRERPESYAVPMQADGGPELLQALIEHGLFDAQMAIEAASAEAGLFCWPEGAQKDLAD
jgi:hypothetical protein